MIGKDRIGKDIDPEDRSQSFQTGPDPFSAWRVISTREWIISGQKGPPDAALDAVNDTDFVGIEQFSAQWSWHDKSPIPII
jgi:hypothetical protein